MVDRIRALCKEQGTSIFKLEKTLGIGNGTIARWDKSTPHFSRLQAVANALGVSVSYLTGESEQKEKPTPEGELDEKALDMLLERMTIAELQELMGKTAAAMAKRARHG